MHCRVRSRTPRVRPSLVLVSLFLSASCGDSASTSGFSSGRAEQALADYKVLVARNYEDVVAGARQLKAAVDAFVKAPSAKTQQAAKDAWIEARKPYGPSEAFRFYDGPIDDPETGPEGEINGWPLDENYIDYTRDDATAGLINDLKGTPELTRDVIARANEAQGEKALSTGYHAIEFLLWGQDDDEPGKGAGKRPYTDYLTEGGSAANQTRRREYLQIVTDLLLEQLEEVSAQWAPKAKTSFAAQFGVGGKQAQKEALGSLVRALGSLAKAELSGERMTVAYRNRSQEDEHSCFSDNTAADFYGNGLGIQNVWLGKYEDFDGVGLDEVVADRDPKLSEQITEDIEVSLEKLKTLVQLQMRGTPIDVVIQAADASPERKAMLEAIRALKVVGEDMEKVATALGLSVQLEQPSEEL